MKSEVECHKTGFMFNKKVVHDAIRETLTIENRLTSGIDPTDIPEASQDTAISLLIHDVFGGEILKTPAAQGWHFYNRVNGERIDFTGSPVNHFEDIPTSADETYKYIVKEDYTTFFMRFIRAFEEIVGLEKYHFGLTT